MKYTKTIKKNKISCNILNKNDKQEYEVVFGDLNLTILISFGLTFF